MFRTKKTTEPEPHRQLMANGVVNPWDDTKGHDTHPSLVSIRSVLHPLTLPSRSQLAAFKYRHKTREGHYVDSLPTLNEVTVRLPLFSNARSTLT